MSSNVLTSEEIKSINDTFYYEPDSIRIREDGLLEVVHSTMYGEIEDMPKLGWVYDDGVRLGEHSFLSIFRRK